MFKSLWFTAHFFTFAPLTTLESRPGTMILLLRQGSEVLSHERMLAWEEPRSWLSDR